MKIEKTYPPNYEEIVKHFPFVATHTGIVFTYKDVLHAPNLPEDQTISDDLLVHESTHTKQQGDDPDAWWKQYFDDVPFRKSQEVEAYKNQYQFAKARYGTKNANNLLVHLASDLSSEIYGLGITYNQAEKLIKK